MKSETICVHDFTCFWLLHLICALTRVEVCAQGLDIDVNQLGAHLVCHFWYRSPKMKSNNWFLVANSNLPLQLFDIFVQFICFFVLFLFCLNSWFLMPRVLLCTYHRCHRDWSCWLRWAASANKSGEWMGFKWFMKLYYIMNGRPSWLSYARQTMCAVCARCTCCSERNEIDETKTTAQNQR